MEDCKEMEERYATGDWVCVTRFPWQEWAIHTSNIVKYIRFDGKLLEYKLIHKKHFDVLCHVLDGGKFVNQFFNDVGGIDLFVKHYHENNDYGIIKDKPSLDEQVNKSICGDDLMSAYDKPNPVERIDDTKYQSAMWAIESASFSSEANDIQDYVNKILANQKEKL